MDKPKNYLQSNNLKTIDNMQDKRSKTTQSLSWFSPKWLISSYGGIPQNLNLDYNQYRKPSTRLHLSSQVHSRLQVNSLKEITISSSLMLSQSLKSLYGIVFLFSTLELELAISREFYRTFSVWKYKVV